MQINAPGRRRRMLGTDVNRRCIMAVRHKFHAIGPLSGVDRRIRRRDNDAHMKNNSKAVSRHALAMNMRAARTLGGWSQEELGLKCGLKRTYIGALERGEINPGVDNVDRIAKAIGVATHVLLQPPTDAYPLMFGVLKDRADHR